MTTSSSPLIILGDKSICTYRYLKENCVDSK